MTAYKVIHETKYTTSIPVSVCHNQAWLRPRGDAGQTVAEYKLHVSPDPSSLTWRTDKYGNQVAHLSFNEGYEQLVVRSESVITLNDRTEPTSDRPWELVRDEIIERQIELLDDYEFLFPSGMVRTSEALADYAKQDFQPNRPFVESLVALTHRIHTEFEYDPRATTISTPVEHVFKHRKGVCQDFAHVQIAMLRSIGLPARYVSGYVRTGNLPDRADMVGADASHAWLSCFDPATGWVDTDPTNDTLIKDDHVTIGWGRDYSDVPPLRGVFIGGGKHAPKVAVAVQPLDGNE
jgi:transglutaminase-like putative cysteine protease